MRLTLRQSNYIDALFGEYLDFDEYRAWTSRPTAAITGYVSDCCRAETRSLSGDRFACEKCGDICGVQSWWSPLSGGTSRGGWCPGVAEMKTVWLGGCWVQVPTGKTWNVMYVNETRVRNTRASEGRLARGADRIKELGYYFDAPPKRRGFDYWHRTKLAWTGWLGRKSIAEVVGLAKLAGRCEDEWTLANVEAWITEGRELSHARMERAKDRPKEHPWARDAWLVYQDATRARRRKKAA